MKFAHKKLSLAYWFGNDFFVSYSRQDGRVLAIALANGLQERKRSCFIDILKTRPGNEIPKLVLNKLRQANVLAVISTHCSQQSEKVAEEIRTFLQTNKPILIFGTPVGADCLWQQLLPGMPVNTISNADLENGNVDDRLLTLLVNSLTYTHQEKRIRRSIMLALSMLVLFTAGFILSVYFFQSAIRSKTQALTAVNKNLGKRIQAYNSLNTQLTYRQAQLKRVDDSLTAAKKQFKVADFDGNYLYNKADSLTNFLFDLKAQEDTMFNKLERDELNRLQQTDGNQNRHESIIFVFEYDSSVLKTSDYPILDALSAELKSTGEVIELEGYSSKMRVVDIDRTKRRLKWGLDDFYFPIETLAHSAKLSEAKANSIKTFLVNSGVKTDHIKIKEYGQSRQNATVLGYDHDWVEIKWLN